MATKSKAAAAPVAQAVNVPSMQLFKAEIFKALSHPTRIRIIEELRGGELSVGQLSERTGIEFASVSQHLLSMRAKGVLQSRKEGLTVYYSVPTKRIYKVMDLLKDWFYEHLDSQRKALEAMDSRNGSR